MLSKYHLILLWLACSVSIACGCKFFTPENVRNSLIPKAYIAVLGTAIEAIEIERVSTRYNMKNPKYLGRDVYFKINSVLKGKVKTDTIIINQYKEGNCSQWFEKGKKYLLIGFKVKKIKDNPEKYGDRGFDEKRRKLTVIDNITLSKAYRDLMNNYSMYNTNQCITFSEDSEIYEKLVAQN